MQGGLGVGVGVLRGGVGVGVGGVNLVATDFGELRCLRPVSTSPCDGCVYKQPREPTAWPV